MLRRDSNLSVSVLRSSFNDGILNKSEVSQDLSLVRKSTLNKRTGSVVDKIDELTDEDH